MRMKIYLGKNCYMASPNAHSYWVSFMALNSTIQVHLGVKCLAGNHSPKLSSMYRLKKFHFGIRGTVQISNIDALENINYSLLLI